MSDSKFSHAEALELHNAVHDLSVSTVSFRGKTLPVGVKSKSGIRFVSALGYAVTAQNKDKSSKHAQMAKAGHKISWFIGKGSWAMIVDGDIMKFGESIASTSDIRLPPPTASAAVASTVDEKEDDSEPTEELDDAGLQAVALKRSVSSSSGSLAKSGGSLAKSGSSLHDSDDYSPAPTLSTIGADTSTPTSSSTKTVSPTPHSKSPSKPKPLCKYGATCYRRNPAHLAAFSHPHLEALVAAASKKRSLDDDEEDDDNNAKKPRTDDVDNAQQHFDTDGFLVPAVPIRKLPQIVREIDWNRITVGKMIGKGAMGSVFQGKYKPPDESDSYDIAIKRLHAADNGELNEKELERFRSELILLSKLSHPNIVTCHGAVINAPAHDSTPAAPLAIIMEFIPETLKRRIRRTGGLIGSLSLTNLLSIAKGIAKGVEFLHNGSIMHRDLKPGNILLEENNAKLCDFGISRTNEGTSNMTRIGTPAFMAPEILKGDAYSNKCDVYSYGMIVWQMSSGKSPFAKDNHKGDASDAFNIILKAAVEHSRPEMVPVCPPALCDLIEECWHRFAHSRPPFTQILKRLEEIESSTLFSTAMSVDENSSSLGSLDMDAPTQALQ